MSEEKEEMLICDENGENCITWDEWMAEMKANDEKKTFRNWFNNLFPKGFASYNSYYILTHPWEILDEWFRQIEWAWQRVFRGWDDTAVWSIDWYLSKQIPQLIRRLKETQHGTPNSMWEGMTPIDENFNYSKEDDEIAYKKWADILDGIAEGFEASLKIQEECLWANDPEYAELDAKFERGFDLFRKYYHNLWD